ncbi:hypothetical protein F8388_015873 [Cannabis sativa]|uniref:PIK-related kinase FAT domain-containing protein n=1 Tax=Cannabis sativa TaxID=3483 RepID=A0A7J6FW52_CANSA|nr:hypothetical protein F8388_015873 [Cannabis sativa]
MHNENYFKKQVNNTLSEVTGDGAGGATSGGVGTEALGAGGAKALGAGGAEALTVGGVGALTVGLHLLATNSFQSLGLFLVRNAFQSFHLRPAVFKWKISSCIQANLANQFICSVPNALAPLVVLDFEKYSFTHILYMLQTGQVPVLVQLDQIQIHHQWIVPKGQNHHHSHRVYSIHNPSPSSREEMISTRTATSIGGGLISKMQVKIVDYSKLDAPSSNMIKRYCFLYVTLEMWCPSYLIFLYIIAKRKGPSFLISVFFLVNKILKVKLCIVIRLRLVSYVGRMRCLAALASPAEPATRLEMAPMAANAAWNMGEWDQMAEYVSRLDDGDETKLRGLANTAASGDGSSNGTFFRAVLLFRRGKCVFQFSCGLALSLDLQSIWKWTTLLTCYVSESYERAYTNMVRVQQLSELEEVIDYCTLPLGNSVAEGRRALICNMWTERIQGAKRNVEVWQVLLAVRALVLPPTEDTNNWLKFASLCRQSGRISQARSTLDKPWYSIEQGSVHFTVISTKRNWKKIQNRHRPMYNSSTGLFSVDTDFAKEVEPLLLANKVLAFS